MMPVSSAFSDPSGQTAGPSSPEAVGQQVAVRRHFLFGVMGVGADLANWNRGDDGAVLRRARRRVDDTKKIAALAVGVAGPDEQITTEWSAFGRRTKRESLPGRRTAGVALRLSLSRPAELSDAIPITDRASDGASTRAYDRACACEALRIGAQRQRAHRAGRANHHQLQTIEGHMLRGERRRTL